MAAYGYFEADFAGAVQFLFTPDFSAVSTKTVMIALGQAFFSVGVGVGFMITYGAYLPGEAKIPRLAGTIAGIDTLVALLAGLAIFPIVFASGLSPAEGPGLVFITMPVAFGAMPFGQVLGTLFFLLLFVAAFTSTLGMLEPIVSYMEEKWQKSRFVLAFSAALVIWAVGLMPALSGSLLSDVRLLGFIPALADRDVFSSFFFITFVIMIPLNAFLIALFAGWVIKPSFFKKELAFKSDFMFQTWRMLLKFVAPLAVLAITVFGLMG
jgi:NSS family neurotransmitter:Na+ symporter